MLQKKTKQDVEIYSLMLVLLLILYILAEGQLTGKKYEKMKLFVRIQLLYLRSAM